MKKYSSQNFDRSISNLKEFGLTKKPFSEIKYKGIIIDNLHILEEEDLGLLIELKKRGLVVINSLSWFERELNRIPSEIITKKDLLMGGFYFKQGSIQMRIKRLFDFFTAILLLILFFPIILISGLLIFIEDGGPILYSQLRTGIDSDKFRIWKLRTMRTNSEIEGVRWASKYDPRITKVGYFLRKTRIDELPQLISVINGNMSLIGPRPERPEFDILLEKEIPHYRVRYLTRPGISGWAQVNYPYGSSIVDASVKLSYDIYYFRNFSLFLDILIFFKTIKLVLNGKGAIPNI